MHATDLRCEYRVDPLGIDVPNPRLGWTLCSDRPGRRQAAYRVVVHSGGETFWDSGRVPSDESAHVVYEGRPLASHAECRWRVQVWDQDGRASDWSPEARWSMGLLTPADWRAAWVALPGAESPGAEDRPEPYLPPCPFFRREFVPRGPVRRAVVYATALGLYEVRLNGRKVGPDAFTPGWTDYHKRVYYNTYDATDLVHEGPNAVGAILADGWYAGHVGLLLCRAAGMPRGRQRYGDRPHLRVQLRLEYADGPADTLGTDDSWKVATGPLLEADLLMGETYDARREFPGWDRAGFDDSGWQRAAVSRTVKARARLQAYPGVPVQETQTLTPVARTEPAPGVFVFDLGQNFAGRVRLSCAGPAGTRVVLRFAEMLHADGSLMTENLQQARATDTYVLKGDGTETWEPRFTYHGFRYVEVRGHPGTPPPEAVTGVVLHSATPPAGSFECSDPLVNRLYQNIVWTQRANFFDVPTDCPQRDERLGWTGDAGVYARSAAWNADVAAFFTKWLVDLDDAQRRSGAYPNYAPLLYQWRGDNANSPAWADAGVIVPYTLYQVYGDTRVIEEHYAAMTHFMEYQFAAGEGFLGPDRGFGDWLAAGETTRKDLIATAYWADDARMMAEMAAAVGRPEAGRYRELFEQIRRHFERVFVHGDARLRGNTQTSYALAINLGLLPPEMLPAAGRNLVERIEARGSHLSAGFVGVRHLLPALTRTGHLDVAYRLLTSTTYPSWGYSIANGATTVWERWDSWTRERGFKNSAMNSFCHYAFGSVCEWLFDTVAGIDTDGPGFRRIIIRPRPGGGLTWVKAGYQSIRGPIRVHWEVLPGGFRLTVAIPANTTAAVHVPCQDRASAEGEGVVYEGMTAGAAVFRVPSGEYVFQSEWNPPTPGGSSVEVVS
jgi:alpha-L-rhamnosidase